MKKTLITLLALSGLAMAESNLLWTATKDNGTWDIVTTEALPATSTISFANGTFTGTGATNAGVGLGDEFSIVITLNCSASTAAAGQQPLVELWKNDGYRFFAGVRTTEGEGLMTFYVQNAAKDYGTQELLSLTPDETQYITLTMSNQEGTGDGMLSAYINGELAATAAMNGAWRNGYLKDIKPSTTFGEVTQVQLYSGKVTPVVPEPATATLSLLALAGLAARRRRH